MAAAAHVEGVGRGELGDAEADGFVPVVIQIGAVIFGAELGVANVPQADERAIGIALQDDVVELSGFGKTADGADADLKLLAGKRRRGADLSGGDFNVLLLRAFTTSSAVRARLAMRTGSSQRRMEYLRSPKMSTSATPGTRFRLSRT